jgi:polygalacturonase
MNMRRFAAKLFLAGACLSSLAPGQAQSTAQSWSVLQEGAKGDGQTDCTAAFQKALDAAGRAGGAVEEVPAGHFRRRCSDRAG